MTHRPTWKRRLALRRPSKRGCLRLALVAITGALLWFGYRVATWPDVAALASTNPETTAFIERYREHERAAGRSDHAEWRWVAFSQISPHLKKAVLVSEDIAFFDHEGFDFDEIRTAIRQAWAERRSLRGASTITQQLAKNLWLSPSRNPLRKVEEAILTAQLERHIDKRRILEIYLNVVELGPGIYGAEAAARHYFGSSARDLDPRQAAALAAALPRPATWHPGSDSRGYQRRIKTILGKMEQARLPSL